jgi:hypothetical protein
MQWSEIPADIVAGHHWVTILTAMFMHAGWMHIISNMVFHLRLCPYCGAPMVIVDTLRLNTPGCRTNPYFSHSNILQNTASTRFATAYRLEWVHAGHCDLLAFVHLAAFNFHGPASAATASGFL